MSRHPYSWTVALRGLSRNKRRNAATGAAIAFGLAALLALAGFANLAENYLRVQTVYTSHGGHLQVYRRDALDRFLSDPGKYALSRADQAKIEAAARAVGGVAMMGGEIRGTGLVGNGCISVPVFTSGIDPALEQRLRELPDVRRWTDPAREFTAGRPMADFPLSIGPVVMAEGLAGILGKTRTYDEAGDARLSAAGCEGRDANVQLLGTAWDGGLSAVDGEVVARFATGVAETNDTALVAPLQMLQRLYETDGVTFYALWLRDTSRLDATARRLEAALGPEFSVYRWTDERVSPYYGGTLQFFHTLIAFLASVLGLVVILSVSNSATMTLIERSPEIGMLRTLGFSRAYVRALFARETFLLAGASALVGGGIGAILIAGINRSGLRFVPPGQAQGMQLLLVPTAWSSAAAVLFVVGLAVLVAWLAARAVAARTIPTQLRESLR